MLGDKPSDLLGLLDRLRSAHFGCRGTRNANLVLEVVNSGCVRVIVIFCPFHTCHSLDYTMSPLVLFERKNLAHLRHGRLHRKLISYFLRKSFR